MTCVQTAKELYIAGNEFWGGAGPMLRVNGSAGSYTGVEGVTIGGNVGSSGRSHVGTTAVLTARVASNASSACVPGAAGLYTCTYALPFNGKLLFDGVPVVSAPCSVVNAPGSGRVVSGVDVTAFDDHVVAAFDVAPASSGGTFVGTLTCVVTQGAVEM